MAYSEVSITPTTAAKMIAEQWTKDIEKPFYKSLYFQDAVTKRTEVPCTAPEAEEKSNVTSELCK